MQLSTFFATRYLVLLTCCFATTVTTADQDVLTTAAANGSFKTLVSLVTAANLDEALQSEGQFTVFAPTDEAFANLPEGVLQSLLKLENRERLANILKYHVLPQRVSVPKKAPDHPLQSAATLNNTELRFARKMVAFLLTTRELPLVTFNVPTVSFM